MTTAQKTFKFLMEIIFFFIAGVSTIYAAISIGTQEVSFQIAGTDRSLVAEMYYPIDQQHNKAYIDHGIWQRQSFIKDAPLAIQSSTYPLVIFSHGWQGDRFGNSWIAESLVKRGYIVVMIDHTNNTSYDHSDIFVYTSLWQRPKDMSHLLTYLLHHSQWKKVIDKNRIAAGGFSLGGLTALWLGGIKGDPKLFKKVMDQKYARWMAWPNTEKNRARAVNWQQAGDAYKDLRIKAVFAIAPDLGQGFNTPGLKGQSIPTLIIVGDQDKVTPSQENATFYAEHMPSTKLISTKDSSHFSFMNKCSELGKEITPHLCQDTLNREQLHEEVSAHIIEFLAEVLN